MPRGPARFATTGRGLAPFSLTPVLTSQLGMGSLGHMTTSTAIDLTEYDGPAPHPDITQALAAFRAEGHTPFQISDDAQAAWAMRKAAAALAKVRDVERVAEAEIERIQAWALEARKSPAHDLAFFQHLLEDYALRERARDADRKTISLPYGSIATRADKATVRVEDTEAFLAWARTNATELIRKVPATEAPALDAIKKTVTIADDAVFANGGEVVPGLAVVPAKTTATAKPEV